MYDYSEYVNFIYNTRKIAVLGVLYSLSRTKRNIWARSTCLYHSNLDTLDATMILTHIVTTSDSSVAFNAIVARVAL